MWTGILNVIPLTPQTRIKFHFMRINLILAGDLLSLILTDLDKRVLPYPKVNFIKKKLNKYIFS
jgi:hypothetical protein